MDDRNLKNIGKPSEFYSPLTWHSNGTMWNEEEEEEIGAPTVTKRTSSTVYLIQKGRDMRSRMQTLYQVRPTPEQDVMRYQDKQRENDTTASMSLSVTARRLGPSYVPQELLKISSSDAKKKQTAASLEKAAAAQKKAPAPILKDLEEKEKTRSSQDPVEDSSALDQTFEQASDEEDEGADYTVNYYESEGEEDDGGGDGGEPTY